MIKKRKFNKRKLVITLSLVVFMAVIFWLINNRDTVTVPINEPDNAIERVTEDSTDALKSMSKDINDAVYN